MREDRRRGVHVEGLSEWVVRSPAGAPQVDWGLGLLVVPSATSLVCV